MKKRAVSLFLALALCLGLAVPALAAPAEANLPDWYFLFAIFKNVDADGKDKDGKAVHVKYTMSQVEVDAARDHAREFEVYMNQLGIIRAHVDVVEIDASVTELNESIHGAYIGPEQAAPLLTGKADLDRYDHVTCVVSLDNLTTSYGGITGSSFENGSGHSCLNFVNQERCLKYKVIEVNPWVPGYPVHEFLHFMERMNRKWGAEFNLHTIMDDFYERVDGEFEECYTDILLNRAKGTAGTGVYPAVWQDPPHVLRTMTELTIPSGVTSIGEFAFQHCGTLTELTISSGVANIERGAFYDCTALTRVTIPSTVSKVGNAAFQDCSGLTEATISSGVASIDIWAFANCTALTRISIPASVTSIGEVAFYKTALKDVYYGGTEAQWKAIQIGDYNQALTNAAIHCNSLMADVKTGDWFAQSVAWALENGIASGTGDGKFSPGNTCTQDQILTLLWRAKGSPAPAGTVSGSEYYAAALQWAKEQKLVSASLDPGSPCTRADVVTYLWKLAGSPTAKAAPFTDVPASAGYAGAVNWALEKGITSGVGADRFAPEQTCTRAEIVTFLYKALAE